MQAVESLAAVADSNMTHTEALVKSGCVDSLLSVLAHANAVSRAVRSAAVLLQYLAQQQSFVRWPLNASCLQVYICVTRCRILQQ